MSTATPAALPPMPGSEPLIRNVDSAPAYWLVYVLWIVLADGNDTAAGSDWGVVYGFDDSEIVMTIVPAKVAFVLRPPMR